MTSTARPSSEWHAAAHPGPAALQGNLPAAVRQAEDATGPGGAWRLGWVLVGLGRFADAWETLSACGAPDHPYGAAAAVTRGSLLRQIGLHDHAENEDVAVAAAAPPGTELAAAAAIGLVADGVGSAVGAEELDRRLQAAGAAVGATGSPRQRIRMAWVAGEVAMVAGDVGLAEGRFNAAAEAAKNLRAQRHHAKSLTFLAAAQSGLGLADEAARTANAALVLAQQMAATPLQWATHLVLADLDDRAGHRQAAAQLLAAALEGLPPGVRKAAASRPPARGLLDG